MDAMRHSLWPLPGSWRCSLAPTVRGEQDSARHRCHALECRHYTEQGEDVRGERRMARLRVGEVVDTGVL
jgi:hypothetical protein